MSPAPGTAHPSASEEASRQPPPAGTRGSPGPASASVAAPPPPPPTPWGSQQPSLTGRALSSRKVIATSAYVGSSLAAHRPPSRPGRAGGHSPVWSRRNTVSSPLTPFSRTELPGRTEVGLDVRLILPGVRLPAFLLFFR